jgi:hypothetical protein
MESEDRRRQCVIAPMNLGDSGWVAAACSLAARDSGAFVPAGKIGSDTRQDDCLVTPAVVFPLGRLAFSVWCAGHVVGGFNFGGRSLPLGSGQGVLSSIAEARARHSPKKPTIFSFFRKEQFMGRLNKRRIAPQGHEPADR